MVCYSFFKSRPHREISPKAAPILTVSLSHYFINYYFLGGGGGEGEEFGAWLDFAFICVL